MYTYCVFCETQKCKTAAKQAEILYGCKAVSPQREQIKWVKKEAIREMHDLLPGYFCLYADEKIEQLEMLYRIPGVIRCLSDQEHQFVLQGDDEKFALMLLDKNGVIGKTAVYQKGDFIQLCEGAYAGIQTRILKVNHRNMRMQIEIPFGGMHVKTWVEYEVVKAVNDGIQQ